MNDAGEIIKSGAVEMFSAILTRRVDLLCYGQ